MLPAVFWNGKTLRERASSGAEEVFGEQAYRCHGAECPVYTPISPELFESESHTEERAESWEEPWRKRSRRGKNFHRAFQPHSHILLLPGEHTLSNTLSTKQNNLGNLFSSKILHTARDCAWPTSPAEIIRGAPVTPEARTMAVPAPHVNQVWRIE